MKIIITSFALAYATSTASASSASCDNMSYAYPSLPWVNYQGDSYIFTRQKYNSVCVDSNGKQYEWGAIEGVYPSISTPGGGCSNLCVKGYGRAEARGCSSSQRPDPNNLVGFEYDCDKAICYCLYQAGTLGNEYDDCFDDMNTRNQGTGEVFNTHPQQGETCYSLQIQPNNPPPPSPMPPVGTTICDYTPNYDCYVDGHPPCCKVDGGQQCPNYLTMCNNHADGETGFDYCTDAPEYQCYNTPDGHPSCCSAPGGAYMNCPKTMPGCDGTTQFVKYLRSNKGIEKMTAAKRLGKKAAPKEAE